MWATFSSPISCSVLVASAERQPRRYGDHRQGTRRTGEHRGETAERPKRPFRRRKNAPGAHKGAVKKFGGR